MRLRKVLSLAICFVFVSVSFVFGDCKKDNTRNIKVWINGNYLFSDAKPCVKEDRTQVPLRFISEELGYKVVWEPSIKGIRIIKDDKEISLKVGSNIATVGKEDKKLDTEVFLKDGRSYVPFRFIGETFGKKVSYDKDFKIAVIGNDFDATKFYCVKYFKGNDSVLTTKEKVNYKTFELKTEKGDISLCSEGNLTDAILRKAEDGLNKSEKNVSSKMNVVTPKDKVQGGDVPVIKAYDDKEISKDRTMFVEENGVSGAQIMKKDILTVWNSDKYPELKKCLEYAVENKANGKDCLDKGDVDGFIKAIDYKAKYSDKIPLFFLDKKCVDSEKNK